MKTLLKKVTNPQVIPSGTGYTVSTKSSKKKGTLLMMNTPVNMHDVYKVTLVIGRWVTLLKQVRANHADDNVAPENNSSRMSFNIPLKKSANLAQSIPTTQPPITDQNPIQPASTWFTLSGVTIMSSTPVQPAKMPRGIAKADAIIKNLKLPRSLQMLVL